MEWNDQLRQRVCPILVCGYGFMGQEYVRELLDLGVSATDLIITDRNPDRVYACRGSLPTIRSTISFSEALAYRPKTAFTLVNTPEHLPVLCQLLANGVLFHFVEQDFRS